MNLEKNFSPVLGINAVKLFLFLHAQQPWQHLRGRYWVWGAVCPCEAVELNVSERNHTHSLHFINTTCAYRQATISAFSIKRNWGLTSTGPSKIVNGSPASFLYLIVF